jgi:hypothetical protein
MLLLVSVVLLTGCYSTPVRHLSSDAMLIKVGESTRKDVLTYLGEPDEQEVIAAGVEKWTYREEERSTLKSAPMVGKYFGAHNYGIVTVILKNDIVVACVYGAYEHDELDWSDDFDWQEK